jgi:hypothetical protein
MAELALLGQMTYCKKLYLRKRGCQPHGRLENAAMRTIAVWQPSLQRLDHCETITLKEIL